MPRIIHLIHPAKHIMKDTTCTGTLETVFKTNSSKKNTEKKISTSSFPGTANPDGHRTYKFRWKCP